MVNCPGFSRSGASLSVSAPATDNVARPFRNRPVRMRWDDGAGSTSPRGSYVTSTEAAFADGLAKVNDEPARGSIVPNDVATPAASTTQPSYRPSSAGSGAASPLTDIASVAPAPPALPVGPSPPQDQPTSARPGV